MVVSVNVFEVFTKISKKKMCIMSEINSTSLSHWPQGGVGVKFPECDVFYIKKVHPYPNRSLFLFINKI